LQVALFYIVNANRDHSHFCTSVTSVGGVYRDGIAEIIFFVREYEGRAFAYYGIAERLLPPMILRN